MNLRVGAVCVLGAMIGILSPLSSAAFTTTTLDPLKWQYLNSLPYQGYTEWNYIYYGNSPDTHANFSIFSPFAAGFFAYGITVPLPAPSTAQLKSGYPFSFDAYGFSVSGASVSATFTSSSTDGLVCYAGRADGNNGNIPISSTPITLTSPIVLSGPGTNVACWNGGKTGKLIVITQFAITYNIDLKVDTPVVAQAGASTNPLTGNLQVSTTAPIQVTVPVSGFTGFDPDTKAAKITVQVGSDAPQSQMLNLADIPPSASSIVPFTIKIDAKYAGTTQTITATVDPDNLLSDGDTSNNSSTTRIDISPLPTVSATELHVEQVVEDPSVDGTAVDLVNGKSASFKVTLQGTSLPLTTSSDSVQVQILSGSTPLTTSAGIPISVSIPIQVISAAPNQQFQVKPSMFPSWLATSLSAPLTVNLSLSEGASVTVDNSRAPTLAFAVHSVSQPKIGFAELSEPGICSKQPCFPPATPSSRNVAAMQTTSTFTTSIFPVADSSTMYVNGISVVAGSDPSSFNQTTSVGSLDPISASLAADFSQLEFKRRQLGYDRIIGIVPKSYFDSHLFPSGTTGYTPYSYLSPSGSNVINAAARYAMVREDDPPVLPHELAHTFGVLYEKYDSTQGSMYDNSPLSGYDALTRTAYSFPASADSVLAWSIMGPSEYQYPYWIDKQTYQIVFGSLLRPPPADPKTIVVSGVMFASGEFIFGPSVVLESGIATPSTLGGSISINAVDSSNQLVNSVSFVPNFKGSVSYIAGSPPGPPVIDTGAMPVVVELPYSSLIAGIAVLQNGKAVRVTSLGSLLLAGIINRIPDKAFKRCISSNAANQQILNTCVSSQRQILSDLTHKIQVRLDNRVTDGSGTKEAQGLLRDLIEKVLQLTLTNYAAGDASELTQSEVISQIAALIASQK